MPELRPATTCDVAIIGGGLAGKAASLHLANAGLKIICIEPEDTPRQAIGESLDWSSPDLLKALGLPMEEVITTRMGTFKRHVILKSAAGQAEDYSPFPWFARAPFHVEIRTLHVDRARLDETLHKKVLESGVTILRDKVVRVEKNGRHISSVHTAGGEQVFSSWFIDASGFATSLLAREFQLRAMDYGPPKVAMWSYFPVTNPIEGTTLYVDPASADYLDWIWEIPINPGVVSVGYVTTGSAMKAKRAQGISVEEIFRQQLNRFPRFESLLREATPGSPNVTSFRCRVHFGVAGPNWLIAGEAAAMVDPITANGVTAALRHAAEASSLILKHRKRGSLPWRARISYNRRVVQMARFFNSGIENVVYQPQVRNRIGMRHAGSVYISPAWSFNLLYSRLRLNGVFSTFLFGLALGFFRASEWIFYRFCKLISQPAENAG
jgi:flavin-dependent dehydrogenase